MEDKDLLLLGIKLLFHHQEVLLHCVDLLEVLMEPHVGLSRVLEEGVEVDLQQIHLILDVVSPLDHHVVQFYVYIC